MNILSILLIIIFAASLIIIALELWSTTAVRKDSPPRFVDCGTGVCRGKKIYFKGRWVKPDFITPFDFNGDFQFLLVNACIHPVIFHAVRGGNRDGKEWIIYQVEYATVLELLKEANRIIDSSKKDKQ
jgi:hypothetical protein|nr:MAG TPA: Poxvirus A28 family [Caudoviricetes sp.]